VRRQDGTNFGPWENLGGKITTAPSLWYEGGRLWVLARGGDGAIWFRVRLVDGSWYPWTSIGGIATSAPSVSGLHQGPAGFLTVNVRGRNGKLYSKDHYLAAPPPRRPAAPPDAWLPERSQWYASSIPTNSAPSVIPSGLVTIVYVLDLDRHVDRYDTSGHTDLGGTVISAPDVSVDDQVVAAVGTNRALFVHTREGGWRSLGGVAA
jgi:hypothetical protein